MKTQAKLVLAVTVLLLSIFSILVNAVPEPPEIDPTTNPFYKNVPDVSGMNRGDIVRWETAQLDNSIFHGATGIRLMYVSENVNGVKVAATGVVFYPGESAPPTSDDQWRTMVWATGTVGIGDDCANSRYPYMYQYNPELWQGRWKPYGDVVYEILSRGYITFAPDYIGTGPEVPGVGQSYTTLAAKTAAIIDGVRAAKALFSLPEHQGALNGYPVSPEFGVLGHSDGGFAAHGIINAIDALGDPDLVLVGTAPFAAPGRRIKDLVEVLAGVHPTVSTSEFGWPYLLYAAQGVEYYADAMGIPFDKQEMIAPDLYSYVETNNAWEACFGDLFESSLLNSANVPPILTEDWDSSPGVQAWLDASTVPISQSSTPRWVHYGKHDVISTWEPEFIQQLCNNNNPVYWTETNKKHEQTLQNVPKTMGWFAELFEGQTPSVDDYQIMTNGCNVPQ